MEKPTKRKAFNFLRSYFDVLNELDKDDDKLKFLLSIINKQFLDEDPKDLNFIVNLCYSSQKHAVEKSVKGWKIANKTDLLGSPTLDPTLPYTPPLIPDPTLPPKEEQEKEQVQVEEQEKEEYKKKKTTSVPIFNFQKALIDEGFDSELSADWMRVRRTKKATNTKTAFKNFIEQVNKTDLKKNEILKLCVTNDWKGFNHTWIKKEKSSAKKESYEKPKYVGGRQTEQDIIANASNWGANRKNRD